MNLIKKYKDLGYSGEQLYQIELGINSKVNIDVYAIPGFNWSQMEQIRLGLENNLDVSIYALTNIPADEMEHIRQKLQFQKEDPETVEKIIYVGSNEVQTSKIISFCGITERCGNTTLVYYLTKLLNDLGHESVAVELNGDDLTSLNKEICFSISKSKLTEFLIQNKSKEFILLDSVVSNQVDETFYTYTHNPIQLNKWKRNHSFTDSQKEKTILNKSVFSKEQKEKLELDLEFQFISTVPFFNEFSYNNEVKSLLGLLGINSKPENKEKRRWFGAKKNS